MFGNMQKAVKNVSVRMIQLNSHAEWLEHREKYLGGSDASAIIGMNGWKSNIDLWLEKTGRIEPKDISDNPNVKFGVAAEPIIRELFKISYPQYEMVYSENNSYINSKYPFAAASLDGLLIEKSTLRKGIWECKTSEIVSSMHKEKWAGQIPGNYYAQLIHYLMVNEQCEFAHLTALLTFRYGDIEIYQQLKHYRIERSDVEDDIQYLAKEEERFWQYVKSGKQPPLRLPEI